MEMYQLQNPANGFGIKACVLNPVKKNSRQKKSIDYARISNQFILYAGFYYYTFQTKFSLSLYC